MGSDTTHGMTEDSPLEDPPMEVGHSAQFVSPSKRWQQKVNANVRRLERSTKKIQVRQAIHILKLRVAIRSANRQLLADWKKAQYKIAKHAKGVQRRCKWSLRTIQSEFFKYSRRIRRNYKFFLTTSKKETNETHPVRHKPPGTTAVFAVDEETVEVVAPLVIYDHSVSWESAAPSNDVSKSGWFFSWGCNPNESKSEIKAHTTDLTREKRTEQFSGHWCFGPIRDDDAHEEEKSYCHNASSEMIANYSSSTDASSESSVATEQSSQTANYFACSSPCQFLLPRKKGSMAHNEILVSRDSYTQTSSLSSNSSLS